MQYAFFYRAGKGVFPLFPIQSGISFRKNKCMQNRYYPLMLVIVYKASTGTLLIHSEKEYFEFIRHLNADVIAFYEAEALENEFRQK
jgi:UDP-3-O-acyl-N-acetylglucosamine deacetylase